METSLNNPAIVPCKFAVILDSSNVIDSPMMKFDWVNLTISTVVALSCPAKTAIAPLDAPFILSPRIVFESSANPLTKTNWSKIGSALLTDSKTPVILNTSGVFNDISLSCTLSPYPVAVDKPWVAIPALVLLMTIELLLEISLDFWEIKSFSRVTLTTFAPLSMLLNVIVVLLLLKTTWLSVNARWVVSVVVLLEIL